MSFVHRMIRNGVVSSACNPGDVGNEVKFLQKRKERATKHNYYDTTENVSKGEGKMINERKKVSENYEETFKQFNYTITLCVGVIALFCVAVLYLTNVVDEKNYKIQQLEERNGQLQETYNKEYNYLLEQYKALRDTK